LVPAEDPSEHGLEAVPFSGRAVEDSHPIALPEELQGEVGREERAQKRRSRGDHPDDPAARHKAPVRLSDPYAGVRGGREIEPCLLLEAPAQPAALFHGQSISIREFSPNSPLMILRLVGSVIQSPSTRNL